MRGVKECCLSCKFFRLVDAETGVCRVEKLAGGGYPTKQTDARCAKWRDSGQQYFIRVGWIKAQKADGPK
ncbi:MAG: hypothetical protein A2X81_19060 [Desulfobacterales bacterium GWB2_56_26]|nr:MAG: hypothetical protein A2X81_19060 [Desulfobacterales bacterium GWB2_56_26]HBG18489.1 hypothetical protein [Desulfobulbaceae bacterium]